ncbi:hypothetical protein ACQJBY_042422 [Aegilops geniculata]
MGYQWKVGNGKKTKFWEDHWFGSCSLAIQFWEIYTIANEHNQPIADLWDGTNLKITFRRCVDNKLLHLWVDLLSIAQAIILNDEEDAIIWKFESNGRYSVRSMYGIVNFRGVCPIHIPKIWQLHVPPNIHIFLWLLAHDKLLFRSNLSKRQHLDDLTCLFCSEYENSNHLFFECAIATEVWRNIHTISGCMPQPTFDNMTKLWEKHKTLQAKNMLISATLWVIWRSRNDICFNKVPWMGMQVILRKIAGFCDQWKILCKEAARDRVERLISSLWETARCPPLLIWPEPG